MPTSSAGLGAGGRPGTQLVGSARRLLAPDSPHRRGVYRGRAVALETQTEGEREGRRSEICLDLPSLSLHVAIHVKAVQFRINM